MFQMAAMCGYAERHGRIPVLLLEPCAPKHHPSSALNVRDFFPRVPVRPELAGESWADVCEPPGCAFTFLEIPNVEGRHVCLRGYFQSPRYFEGCMELPNMVPPPSPGFADASLFAYPWSEIGFLHIRRGDYLHPANAHHRVDLRDYIRSCLGIAECQTWFVVSDDMPWCRRELCGWLGIAGLEEKLLWCPEAATDAETFYWMSLCGGGGICANSTFSWWAAYFLHVAGVPRDRIFMPAVWGHFAAPVRDLWPTWATRVGI
jgi:Glycosyl transferase family 11